MGRQTQQSRAAAIAAAAFFILRPAPVFANPSMSDDFTAIMRWLSHEIVQGLAFNAGSSFDPPREVTDKRLQPDISIGAGRMPFDKSKFPDLKVQALRDLDAKEIFPSNVLFPNLSMHLRAGLPGRSDFALRFADMTTPPGYKISPTATGQGQSNSFGLSLRRHFLGGERPLLSVGAHYNHVYGRFKYQTKFKVDDIAGFTADSKVDGGIHWNINSFAFNAVVSQNYGMWTPFFGFGYNYVTGSVRTTLEANSYTPLILPIKGQASERPEQSQGRVILGAQLNRSWANVFANGEIKTIGIGAGKTWIAHAGLSLPFHIGRRSGANRYAKRRAQTPAPKKEIFNGPTNETATADDGQSLIFIQ